MGDKSAIQWTDASWNPTTGCDRVSPGCANCYALTWAARMKEMGQPAYQNDGDPKTSGPGFALTLHEDRLMLPFRWAKPRRIFVNSMSDLFHESVPDAFIDRVFATMALTPQHTYQVLTKRPERMRAYMHIGLGAADRARRSARTQRRVWKATEAMRPGAPWPGWPLPNVWLGTSVENARWRTRIDELRAIPAAVRFLSCEPLLGPLVTPPGQFYVGSERVDPAAMEFKPMGLRVEYLDLTGIGWVIVGGESGKGARPMDEDWVRDVVREARRQGAAVFVKQMGDAWSREHLGRGGHAGNIETFPADLRIREFPG